MRIRAAAVTLLSLAITWLPARGQVSEGDWVGSVRSANGPPTAARFVVETIAGRVSITLMVPGLPVTPVQDLRINEDNLSFRWSPGSSVSECELRGNESEGYAGECVWASGGQLQVEMMPPGTTPVGLASHALQHPQYQWASYKTEHINVYTLEGSYTHERRDFLAEDAEQARANGLRILGVPDYPKRINFFYLNSREATQGLLVEPAWGRADPFGDTVVLAWNTERTLFQRHEIMHVLSYGLWGVAGLPFGWISEGLAVFAQGECKGHDLHELSHAMDERSMLIPIDTLVNQFWEQNDVVAYVQAGSLVRHIFETHGRDALRALWRLGVPRILEAMGITLDQLDTEWRGHVADVLVTGTGMDWGPSDGC